MATRWERPTITTSTIAGGYVLVRSHAVLALWQAYRDGHVQLLDVRSALAAVEVSHRVRVGAKHRWAGQRRAASGVSCAPETAAIRHATACSDDRKTRAALKRLANAGVPPEQLVSRAKSTLHVTVRVTGGVADRPVPVSRRWLRMLATDGTAATIGVALALLLRGSFLHRGVLKLGGTCRAAWVAETFAMDERTAKAGRAELISLGWVSPSASPAWHRQRHGATFTLNPEPVERQRHAPESPPPRALIVPGSPPPSENKNLPLRGSENQNRLTGDWAERAEVGTAPSKTRDRHLAPPTLSNIRASDLCCPSRTLGLLHDAQRRGLIGNAGADRLRFFTTVQHASHVGTRPEALMAALARRRCWHYGSQLDEENARRTLAILDSDTTVYPISHQQQLTTMNRPDTPSTRSRGFEPIGTVLAALVPSLGLTPTAS